MKTASYLFRLHVLPLCCCRGRILCTCPRIVYAHRARRVGGLRHHGRSRFHSIHCGSQALRHGPFVRWVRAHAFLRRAFIFEEKLWTGLQPGIRRPARIRRFRHGNGFGNAGRMGIRRAWSFRAGPDAALSPHLVVHFEDDVSTMNIFSLNEELFT